jgi:hypothetical protein
LAGEPGGAGGVGGGSQLSSSVAKPAEHVGRQIGGAGGCWATAGRGGMRGGVTTTGGSGGGAAQAVKSSAQALSVSASRLGLLECGIYGLLLQLVGLRLAPSEVGLSLAGGLGGGGHGLGVRALALGQLGGGQALPEPKAAGHQQHHGQQAGSG